MANKEYVIPINVLLNPTGSSTGNVANKPVSSPAGGTTQVATSSKSISIGDINQVVRQGSKLINAFGLASTEEDKAMMRATQKLMSYGVKTSAAILSGNPMAYIDLIVDAICDITQKVRENAQKIAAKENEQDMARLQAGLLNLEGAYIKTDSFSGRYNYISRK